MNKLHAWPPRRGDKVKFCGSIYLEAGAYKVDRRRRRKLPALPGWKYRLVNDDGTPAGWVPGEFLRREAP